jgi:hypothetical protein
MRIVAFPSACGRLQGLGLFLIQACGSVVCGVDLDHPTNERCDRSAPQLCYCAGIASDIMWFKFSMTLAAVGCRGEAGGAAASTGTKTVCAAIKRPDIRL